MRRVVAIATLCGSLGFAVSACASTGAPDGSAEGERDRPRHAETRSGGAEARPSAVRGVRLRRIGSFDSPTYLAAPPGERGRRLVVEREGRIVLVERGRRSTFLDISASVRTLGEEGMLSMAFHPGYARNRRYFVYYVDRAGAIAIRQFRSTPDGRRTRRGSGRRVLRLAHPRTNHKGGQLQFGPDGMLYAGFGDGGSSGDPDRNAQDRSTLLGSIVRIDPRPRGGYRVPRGNPFAGSRAGRGEIFAYGLRNPYRFSFDRRTGDLAIADVGQDAVEEIDLLPARRRGAPPRGGANLGWPAFEGRRRFYPDERAPGHVPPVLQRTHAQGSCSIIGGYVLRAPLYGRLRGRYVYGDLCDPRLRIARLRRPRARGDRRLGVRVPQLVSFGEDARGRVFALSLSGGVFLLAPRR